MRPVHTFSVIPSLPPAIEGCAKLPSIFAGAEVMSP